MKKPVKTVVQESDAGVVYRFDVVPGFLFNFYIEQKQEYKDGTHKFNICMELASNPKKFWVLDSVRGFKANAVRRLDEIIKNGL